MQNLSFRHITWSSEAVLILFCALSTAMQLLTHSVGLFFNLLSF